MPKPHSIPDGTDALEDNLLDVKALVKFALFQIEHSEPEEFAKLKSEWCTMMYLIQEKVDRLRHLWRNGRHGPSPAQARGGTPLNALQNFAFEEHLVRVIERDGEPWFVGKDVCTALGLSMPASNHLRNLDEDERGMFNIHTPSGDQQMVAVSEPGVYRLVFRSRKPEAERFKRWLAHEVLPQIRRTGQYAPARPQPPAPFEIDIQHAPLSAKTDYLRMVAKLRGREAAVALMPHIGLPDLDAIIGGARIMPGGMDCLKHLLDWRDEEGDRIRDLITAATQHGQEYQKRLMKNGVRAVLTGEPGILVATNTRPVRRIFEGTRWANGAHNAALRGIAGVEAANPVKFDGYTSRTLFIPAHLLA